MDRNFHLQIMHVDDHPDDYDLFRRAVAIACPECEVVSVNSPKLALSILASSTAVPHLIVSDGSFREMDAPTFIRELRLRYPGVPVVALSGSKNPEIIKRAYEAGASMHVRKPETFEDLKQRVQQLIELLSPSDG